MAQSAPVGAVAAPTPSPKRTIVRSFTDNLHSKDLDETRVWNGAGLETETRSGRGKDLHPSLSSNAHEIQIEQGLGRSKGLDQSWSGNGRAPLRRQSLAPGLVY